MLMDARDGPTRLISVVKQMNPSPVEKIPRIAVAPKLCGASDGQWLV